MRMSTRGRFGLRALLHIAMCERDVPVSVAALAKRMGVSADYLMQLFVRMRRAGLVKSVRGPRGGFRLAKPAARLTVGDIVRAVEGPIAVTACVEQRTEGGRRRRGAPADTCARRANCVARLVWLRISDDIGRILDGTNLADILAEARRQGMVE